MKSAQAAREASLVTTSPCLSSASTVAKPLTMRRFLSTFCKGMVKRIVSPSVTQCAFSIFIVVIYHSFCYVSKLRLKPLLERVFRAFLDTIDNLQVLLGGCRCLLCIQDVLALVYLHSLSSPILHICL